MTITTTTRRMYRRRAVRYGAHGHRVQERDLRYDDRAELRFVPDSDELETCCVACAIERDVSWGTMVEIRSLTGDVLHRSRTSIAPATPVPTPP